MLLFLAGLVLCLDGWRYYEAAIASDDTEALAPFLQSVLRLLAGLFVFIAIGQRVMA